MELTREEKEELKNKIVSNCATNLINYLYLKQAQEEVYAEAHPQKKFLDFDKYKTFYDVLKNFLSDDYNLIFLEAFLPTAVNIIPKDEFNNMVYTMSIYVLNNLDEDDFLIGDNEELLQKARNLRQRRELIYDFDAIKDWSKNTWFRELCELFKSYNELYVENMAKFFENYDGSNPDCISLIKEFQEKYKAFKAREEQAAQEASPKKLKN